MYHPSRRIDILGTRGVPANYGGFETFAEQLGKRLVERGQDELVRQPAVRDVTHG